MARFHVYSLVGTDRLVIDVQADLLDILKTRIVAPLLRASELDRTIDRLNPRFIIGDQTYILATHLLTAIPASEMQAPVADLTRRGDDITTALDFAFQGF